MKQNQIAKREFAPKPSDIVPYCTLLSGLSNAEDAEGKREFAEQIF